MLPAQGIWRETVSLLDVMWPWTSQWMGGKNASYITNSLCMGYSLCKMADFQNRLISGLFGVFSRGFLHRTTLMFLQYSFSKMGSPRSFRCKDAWCTQCFTYLQFRVGTGASFLNGFLNGSNSSITARVRRFYFGTYVIVIEIEWWLCRPPW